MYVVINACRSQDLVLVSYRHLALRMIYSAAQHCHLRMLSMLCCAVQTHLCMLTPHLNAQHAVLRCAVQPSLHMLTLHFNAQHAVLCIQVLAEELPLLLASLNFKRSMRWRGSTAYSRPLRWLMALHGSTALPLTYAGLSASKATRLLRNSRSPIFQVSLSDPQVCTLL